MDHILRNGQTDKIVDIQSIHMLKDGNIIALVTFKRYNAFVKF